MIDNFLPTFDMAKEKELKKDLDIDGQIEVIKNDILSRKEFIYYKKPFTDVKILMKSLNQQWLKDTVLSLVKTALTVKYVLGYVLGEILHLKMKTRHWRYLRILFRLCTALQKQCIDY